MHRYGIAALLAGTILPVTMLAATPAQAKLSPAEAKMAAAVDADFDASVAFLEKLVNQNSGSNNIDGVTRAGMMVKPLFEELGFDTIWKPLLETKRAGHLIAVHKGKPGGKKLLLIGHVDTVFEPDSPFQTFTREGDKATGPGVNDDKGGVIVMLTALRAMKAAGTLKDANIEVILTGDEESSGSPKEIARGDLVAMGKRADIALDFEPLATEDGHDMGSISRRGGNGWTLTVTGKAGHSSRIFSAEAGDGAIYEMARIITAFRKELPEPNLTLNVGLMGGGQTAAFDKEAVGIAVTGKSNIVPPIAVAKGDMRTLSPEQTDRIAAKMQGIVDREHLPGTSASISFARGYPAMQPTEGNKALLVKLNGVNSDLGLAQMPTLDPLKRGGGDISVVAGDVDGLVGLGAAGDGAHAAGETIDLQSIRRQGKRAAILMSRLAAEKTGK